MPELPEVQTIVSDLNKKIIGKKIVDVWCDWPKILQKPKRIREFKKKIKGAEIKKAWRRAKFIIIDTSFNLSIIFHMRMTGHLLLFNPQLKIKNHDPIIEDPVNRFIHFKLIFADKTELWFSDMRKFGTIALVPQNEVLKEKSLAKLGPEPLDEKFTFTVFSKQLGGQRGKIKQVLQNQEVIAGIGNIYADEILWEAKVHPKKLVSSLTPTNLRNIFTAIKKILAKAIVKRGTSVADFRDTAGKKGFYNGMRKAYQRTGEPCMRCGKKIKRIVIGGRGTHYCPKCQKI